MKVSPLIRNIQHKQTHRDRSRCVAAGARAREWGVTANRYGNSFVLFGVMKMFWN